MADSAEKAHLLHALDDKYIAVGPVLGRGAFGVVRFGGVYSSPPTDGSHDDTGGIGTCTASALKDIPMTKWRAVAREVIAMVRCLGHPNIVRLQGLRRLPPDLDAPYERAQLVLDYAAGGNLAGIAASWTHALGDKNAGDGNAAVGNVAASGGGRDSAAASCDLPKGLPEYLARKYMKDLFEALVCVHESGLAHCDVKGANMLLSADGRALLSDFGSCYLESLLDQTEEQVAAFLAPMNTDSGLGSTNTGATPFESEENRRSLFPGSSSSASLEDGGPAGGANSPQERGTLRWTPPELIGGGNGAMTGGGASPNKKSSPRASNASTSSSQGLLQQLQAADIWAAGCTLLELLTGTPPWWWLAADSADVMVTLLSTDVRAEVPKWMSPLARDFMMLCLTPEPIHRAKAADLLRHPFLSGYAPLVPLADAPCSLLRAGLNSSSLSADEQALYARRRAKMVSRTTAVSVALSHSRLARVPLAIMAATPAAGGAGGAQAMTPAKPSANTPAATAAASTTTTTAVDVACSAKYALVCLWKLESVGRIACRTLQRRLEAAAAAAVSSYGSRHLASPRAGAGAGASPAFSLESWMEQSLYHAASACSCRGRETVTVEGLWAIWERSLLLHSVFRSTANNAATTTTGMNAEETVARFAFASKLVRKALFNSHDTTTTSATTASPAGVTPQVTAKPLRIQVPHSDLYASIVFGNPPTATTTTSNGEEVFGPTTSAWLLLATKVADELAAALPSPAVNTTSTGGETTDAPVAATSPDEEEKLLGLSSILKALLVARVREWRLVGEAAFGRFGLDQTAKPKEDADSSDDDGKHSDDNDDDDDGAGWKRMQFACCSGPLKPSTVGGRGGVSSPYRAMKGSNATGPGHMSLRSLYLLHTWLGSARRSLLLSVGSSLSSSAAKSPSALGPHLSPLQPIPFSDVADAGALVDRTLHCAEVMPRAHVWSHELSAAIKMLWLLRMAEARVAAISPSSSSSSSSSDAFLCEVQLKVAACWAWLQSLWVHASSLADMPWTEQLLLFGVNGSAGLHHHGSGGGFGNSPASPAPSPATAVKPIAPPASSAPADVAFHRLSALVEDEDDEDDDDDLAAEGKDGIDDEIEWTDDEEEDDEEEEDEFGDCYEDEDEAADDYDEDDDDDDDAGDGKRGFGRTKSRKQSGSKGKRKGKKGGKKASAFASSADGALARPKQLRTLGRSCVGWVTRASDMHIVLGTLEPRMAASASAAPSATPAAPAGPSLKRQALLAYETVLSNARQRHEQAQLARNYEQYCHPYGPNATAPWQRAVLAQLGRLYMAIAAYYPEGSGGDGGDDGGSSGGTIPLQQGEVVLCIAEDDSGWWCVRRLTKDTPLAAVTSGNGSGSASAASSDGRALEGWVPAGYLCKVSLT